MTQFAKPKPQPNPNQAFRRLREFVTEWETEQPHMDTVMASPESQAALKEVYIKISPAQKSFLLVPTASGIHSQPKLVYALLDVLKSHNVPGSTLMGTNVVKFGIGNCGSVLLSYFDSIRPAALHVATELETENNSQTTTETETAVPTGTVTGTGTATGAETGTGTGAVIGTVAGTVAGTVLGHGTASTTPSRESSDPELPEEKVNGEERDMGLLENEEKLPGSNMEARKGGGVETEEGTQEREGEGVGMGVGAEKGKDEGEGEGEGKEEISTIEGLAMAGGALVAGGVAAATGVTFLAVSGAAIAGGMAAATLASGLTGNTDLKDKDIVDKVEKDEEMEGKGEGEGEGGVRGTMVEDRRMVSEESSMGETGLEGGEKVGVGKEEGIGKSGRVGTGGKEEREGEGGGEGEKVGKPMGSKVAAAPEEGEKVEKVKGNKKKSKWRMTCCTDPKARDEW